MISVRSGVDLEALREALAERTWRRTFVRVSDVALPEDYEVVRGHALRGADFGCVGAFRELLSCQFAFAKGGARGKVCTYGEKGKQVTWGGRFSDGPSELMLRIGESVSFDRALARFDVQGSQAQAAMLAHVGLITEAERMRCRQAWQRFWRRLKRVILFGTFALEDVHMNIEQALTERVPAAKLHTARSGMIRWRRICGFGFGMLVIGWMLRFVVRFLLWWSWRSGRSR